MPCLSVFSVRQNCLIWIMLIHSIALTITALTHYTILCSLCVCVCVCTCWVLSSPAHRGAWGQTVDSIVSSSDSMAGLWLSELSLLWSPSCITITSWLRERGGGGCLSIRVQSIFWRLRDWGYKKTAAPSRVTVGYIYIVCIFPAY